MTRQPPAGQAPYTVLDDAGFRRTLGQRLIPTIDRLRDLNTTFGLRPYTVRLIRTRWSDGVRGMGLESLQEGYPIALLPTPRITDLDQVVEVVNPVGVDEVGSILLSEVSGQYTEDDLRGWVRGMPPDQDEQFYYEVEFRNIAEAAPGQRRRFIADGAPMWQPEKFQWIVKLAKAYGDRQRNGDPNSI